MPAQYFWDTPPGTPSASATVNPTFSANPQPQAGSGQYGAVPGPIGIPPNIYQGVSSIYPQLGQQTGAAGDLINSQLAGEFTPGTEKALWDTANRWGVASGMPGAGTWANKFMGNVAGAKEALQQQGLGNYQSVLKSLGSTVTDPNLAASIAGRNATMAAAPNPTLATWGQLSQFWNALNSGRNMSPQGGTGQVPSTDISGLIPGGGNPGGGTVVPGFPNPNTNAPYTPTESDAWASIGVDPNWLSEDFANDFADASNPTDYSYEDY